MRIKPGRVGAPTALALLLGLAACYMPPPAASPQPAPGYSQGQSQGIVIGSAAPPPPVVVPMVVTPVISAASVPGMPMASGGNAAIQSNIVPVMPAPVMVAAPLNPGGAASPTMVTPIGPLAMTVAAAPASGRLAAAVAPQMMPPQSALGGQGVYVVKQGGRLATVARKTGSSLDALIRLNPGLSSDTVLPAGTRVLLPVPWAG
jgi:hypothetical protein